MSREIKFRVAEFNEGKFVGFLYLDPVKESFDTCWLRYDDPDVVIQQFTGLHDKNGKEIYEGDLVDENMVEGEKSGLVYKVGFDRGHFTLTDIKNGYDKLGIWNVHSNLEILGNIYENPDLLGGKK